MKQHLDYRMMLASTADDVEYVMCSGPPELSGLRIANEGPGAPGGSFRFLAFLQGKNIQSADRFLTHLVTEYSNGVGIIAGDS